VQPPARPSHRVSLWTEGTRVGLLYLALTIVLAYPLTRHPAASVLPMASDTDFYLWVLQWDVHALTHRPLAIFDANIYFPFRHTLAYSENLIGCAIVAAPILWTTSNPVLALNVVALLSCVLCGVGAYVLARRVGIGPLGATLAGIIFAFAPPHFFRLGQLHLTTVQWVPFCLAFTHAYLDSGRRQDLWWACLFFAVQVLTSAHGAVFAVLGVLLLLIWRVALGEPIQIAKRVRDFGVPGAVTIGLAVLIFLPYRTVQREMGLRRSLGEATYFSPNPSSFLASPTRLHTFVRSAVSAEAIPSDASAFLFPGYLPIALAAVALWRPPRMRGRTPFQWMAVLLELAAIVALVAAVALTIAGGARLRYGSTVILSARDPWRAWLVCAGLMALRAALLRVVPLAAASRIRACGDGLRRWAAANRRSGVGFYALLLLVAGWLSLGPPYLLYRLVYDLPGISFIRVPSRFTLVALLALAILAAAGFERLAARFDGRIRRILAVAAAAVLVAEFFAAPLNAVPYSVDIPSVDRWLAAEAAPVAVAELPLASPADVVAWARRQSLYMLHSTAHWHRTVHGYSGLQPALHDKLYSQLLTFPNTPVLDSLSSIGVTHVVIHTDLYPRGEWPKVERQVDLCKAWLTLEHADGAGRVYSLHRPADLTTQCLP
jgi:hypothetical protein